MYIMNEIAVLRNNLLNSRRYLARGEYILFEIVFHDWATR